MDELMVEHVLRAVECIPPGRVQSYGAVADLMGGTARQVGSVMRFYGSNVAWWRVVNASGDLPAHLVGDAGPRWAAEGIEWKPNGRGCDIRRHRVDERAWTAAYADATADLTPYERLGRGRRQARRGTPDAGDEVRRTPPPP